MQKIAVLDANAVLRYVITDNKEQADIVKEVVQNREVLILPEVIAEVVYVLTKFYNYSIDLTVNAILCFLEDAKCDDAVVINAVTTFGESNMDFIDCILCEYSKNPQYEIITFDKKLLRAIESDAVGDCGIA